jgi:hypothetical protein
MLSLHRKADVDRPDATQKSPVIGLADDGAFLLLRK